MWKDGIIISRTGITTYMIQVPDWRHKRHVNQLKHRFTREEMYKHIYQWKLTRLICQLLKLSNLEG